ncbi:MAG: HlyC/CorC family transporter [Chloroflexi bacterium]|nr:MAG: HlyC/CorC family transporter [Chloroflexota bacterium]RLC96141.1 MAG: HlyC/CorC family transporter [Chloroflexota bacterium]
MDATDTLYLVLALICVLLSAFFSSSETAFISLQRIRLKHLESKGVAGAGRVARMMEKPERFLSTVLLGNNFVNTAAAALGTAVALSLLPGNERIAVLVATILVTVILLVVAEIVPKIAAAQHGEKMALIYVTPIMALSWLLSPATAVLEWIGTRFSRLVGGEPVHRALVTEEEIRTMISVGREQGIVEEAEAKMLDKVFEFGDQPVHDAITPRPDVVWLEKGTTLAQFLQVYANSPHSRFPVYEETPDNIVGVLSIKDVLMGLAHGKLTNENSLDHLIRPTMFVPESKRIGELFAEMQAANNQMAIVVDEYGGIDGIVTMEQLVEQIVGHVGDELARRAREFQAIDEYTYDVDGNVRIDDLNEQLNLALPPGEYETIAGFVLSRLGHIPKEGESIPYGDLRVAVKEMRGMKIEKLRITKVIR